MLILKPYSIPDSAVSVPKGSYHPVHISASSGHFPTHKKKKHGHDINRRWQISRIMRQHQSKVPRADVTIGNKPRNLFNLRHDTGHRILCQSGQTRRSVLPGWLPHLIWPGPGGQLVFRRGWWPSPFPKNYEIAHIKLGAEVKAAVTLGAFSERLCPFRVHNSRDTQQKDVDDNDDGGD